MEEKTFPWLKKDVVVPDEEMTGGRKLRGSSLHLVLHHHHIPSSLNSTDVLFSHTSNSSSLFLSPYFFLSMKLFSFSSSSSSSTVTTTKGKKSSRKEKNKKTPSISRSDLCSFNSTSSSDTSATPTTVLPPPISTRRAYIGRNASCLDPEYEAPSETTASVPSSSYSSSSSLRFDGDCRFTCEELEQVFRRLGGKDDVSEILAEADRDGDGRISLEEFLKEKKELEEEELRVAFDVYDMNGDGKISAEELFEVFRMLGDQECRIEDCRRMIGGVDSDGDGFVCFKDFAKMMMSMSVV